MREKSGCARKREDESPSVGDGRKSTAEERRGGATRGKGGGRTKEGYAVEKVVDIEEGRGRVGRDRKSVV